MYLYWLVIFWFAVVLGSYVAPRIRLYRFLRRGWPNGAKLVEFKPMWKLMGWSGLATGFLMSLIMFFIPNEPIALSLDTIPTYILGFLFFPFAILFANLFETFVSWWAINTRYKLSRWLAEKQL